MKDQLDVHLRMHRDHSAWNSDIKMWEQDLKTWDLEFIALKEAMKSINQAIDNHEGALKSHGDSIKEHRGAVQKHETGLKHARENASFDAVTGKEHEKERRRHDHTQDAHERLKRYHHSIIILTKGLKQALENAI